MASKKSGVGTTKAKARKTVVAPKAMNGGVDAFMASLDHPKKAEIEALRKIFLGVDRRIEESIKWNAPSFAIGEHFATFKLRPAETVQIVFHTGAKVKPNARAVSIDDPAGLLRWAAPDRCIAILENLAEIRAKKSALTAIVKQWIAHLDRS